MEAVPTTAAPAWPHRSGRSARTRSPGALTPISGQRVSGSKKLQRISVYARCVPRHESAAPYPTPESIWISRPIEVTSGSRLATFLSTIVHDPAIRANWAEPESGHISPAENPSPFRMESIRWIHRRSEKTIPNRSVQADLSARERRNNPRTLHPFGSSRQAKTGA